MKTNHKIKSKKTVLTPQQLEIARSVAEMPPDEHALMEEGIRKLEEMRAQHLRDGNYIETKGNELVTH